MNVVYKETLGGLKISAIIIQILLFSIGLPIHLKIISVCWKEQDGKTWYIHLINSAALIIHFFFSILFDTIAHIFLQKYKDFFSNVGKRNCLNMRIYFILVWFITRRYCIQWVEHTCVLAPSVLFFELNSYWGIKIFILTNIASHINSLKNNWMYEIQS